jgi:hypothetical protein
MHAFKEVGHKASVFYVMAKEGWKKKNPTKLAYQHLQIKFQKPANNLGLYTC